MIRYNVQWSKQTIAKCTKTTLKMHLEYQNRKSFTDLFQNKIVHNSLWISIQNSQIFSRNYLIKFNTKKLSLNYCNFVYNHDKTVHLKDQSQLKQKAIFSNSFSHVNYVVVFFSYNGKNTPKLSIFQEIYHNERQTVRFIIVRKNILMSHICFCTGNLKLMCLIARTPQKYSRFCCYKLPH